MNNTNSRIISLQWKKLALILLRLFLFFAYLITTIILLFNIRKCIYFCDDKHNLAVNISVCCFIMTAPISIYHTIEHLNNFTKPKLQSQVVRIIWMPFVYSLESLISTIYVENSHYFQVIREIYESYVLYCFMRYLMSFLGDSNYLSSRLSTMPALLGIHKPPFCCLTNWAMGYEFLRKCKSGVFQFVVCRITTSISSIIFHYFGWYVEGNYSVTSIYMYITIINCLSQTLALYSLFLFYQATHKELIIINPFYKFLSIKLIVFFCWWQELLIVLLVRIGHINQGHGHSVQEIGNLIQNLLISLEMFIAAIGFYYSFPVNEKYSIDDFNSNELNKIDNYNEVVNKNYDINPNRRRNFNIVNSSSNSPTVLIKNKMKNTIKNNNNQKLKNINSNFDHVDENSEYNSFLSNDSINRSLDNNDIIENIEENIDYDIESIAINDSSAKKNIYVGEIKFTWFESLTYLFINSGNFKNNKYNNNNSNNNNNENFSLLDKKNNRQLPIPLLPSEVNNNNEVREKFNYKSPLTESDKTSKIEPKFIPLHPINPVHKRVKFSRLINEDSNQISIIGAFWQSVVPDDLQEDFNELSVEIFENFINKPYVLYKKIIKEDHKKIGKQEY